jgi:hypothetical protein
MDEFEQRIDRLARQLPRELSPETDLWPHIVAEIDATDQGRFRQLARDIEPSRDLWAGIRVQLGAGEALESSRRPRIPYAAAAGVLAMVAMVALMTSQMNGFRSNGTPFPGDSSPVVAAGLPDWMVQMLGQYADAAPGTSEADLNETARAIERDFLMVQSERLRIEQVLGDSPNDTNLRAQWRHVYLAELQLIDEVQKLGNLYESRSAI